MTTLSTFAHHGILFVPFGYYSAFPQMSNIEEVHGGMSSRAPPLECSDGLLTPGIR
jgi:NAD(P)H dehydrogenase (quinone)